MNIDLKEMLETLEERLGSIDYVRLKDIPEIDLYMDQVTTFMDTHLGSMKRYPEDKILTKTMINNYAKNNLLPPPVKKKYSKDHMLVLTFIYYFKNLLPIKDIESLLKPLTDEHFNIQSDASLSDIYSRVSETAKAQMKELPGEMEEIFTSVKSGITEKFGEDKDNSYIEYFSIICYLAFDTYMKKFIIEQLIDQMTPPDEPKNKKPK